MLILISLVCLCLFACAEVQQGTGQALDNANEVIDSGSKKLWIPKHENRQEEPQDELSDYR
ncbi:MAG: hypothetical protein R3A13_05935 [Bdellovibrionota bacterium]